MKFIEPLSLRKKKDYLETFMAIKHGIFTWIGKKQNKKKFFTCKQNFVEKETKVYIEKTIFLKTEFEGQNWDFTGWSFHVIK
jgi:hypothetical protein